MIKGNSEMNTRTVGVGLRCWAFRGWCRMAGSGSGSVVRLELSVSRLVKYIRIL